MTPENDTPPPVPRNVYLIEIIQHSTLWSAIWLGPGHSALMDSRQVALQSIREMIEEDEALSPGTAVLKVVKEHKDNL